MDLEEYRNNLKKMVNGISAYEFTNQIFVPAVDELLATIKNRIMREGRSSTNEDIGAYSQNPFYATRDMFIKKSAFKPTNKTGETSSFTRLTANKKTGKYIKTKKTTTVAITPMGQLSQTMYLPNGYMQLRQIQGLDVSRVNLTYSGSMMQSYMMGVRANQRLIVIGFRSTEEYKKAMENEFHFKKKIFTGTTEEIEKYKQNVFDAFKEYTLNNLQGLYGAQSVSGDL